MKLRKMISVLCVTAMTASLMLAGCGKSEGTDKSADKGTETPADGETMVIPVMSDISTFYTLASDDIANEILSPGFENLFTVTGAGEINWHLAESCDLSEDGLTYTLKLRDGLTFSDGNPVTADDVVFSMSSDGADFMGYYPYFANGNIAVEAVDDTTVTITLEQPCNSFIQRIGTCRVMEKALYDGVTGEDLMSCDAAMEGVGCGPYKMTEWKQGESITYEARDDYYGGTPSIKKIVFKVMPDASAQELAFQNGEINMFRISSADQLKKYSEDDNYTVFNIPEQRVNMLTVNASSTKITSTEMKQAIFAAIDPQEIVDQVYGDADLAKTAGGMYVDDTQYFDTSMANYTYDAEQAADLAKSSGLADQTLTLLYFNDRENMENYAMVIQQQLKAAGINCEIVGEDAMTGAQEWQGGTDKYDLVLNGWDNMQGNPGFEWAIYANGSGAAYYAYSDDTLAKLNTAITATTEEDITAGYQAFQKSAFNDYWAYPLVAPNYVMVTQKGYEGLDANAIVPVFDDWTAITYNK